MRCMHACLVPGETSEITVVLVWYAIPYLLPTGGEKVGCKCHTSSQSISLQLYPFYTSKQAPKWGCQYSLRSLPHSEWRLILLSEEGVPTHVSMHMIIIVQALLLREVPPGVIQSFLPAAAVASDRLVRGSLPKPDSLVNCMHTILRVLTICGIDISARSYFLTRHNYPNMQKVGDGTPVYHTTCSCKICMFHMYSVYIVSNLKSFG